MNPKDIENPIAELDFRHQLKNDMNIQMMEYKGPCGLIKIVEQLEFCKYQTKDGLHDLKDNLAFQALKELAKEQFDNYDGPQDGDAWSGGFAENH